MAHERKNIIITGASRRLGLLLCEQFCAQGHQVFAITREPSQELTALAALTSVTILPIENYTHDAIENVINEVRTKLHRVHGIVHNASVFTKNDAYDAAQFQQFFDIHMACPAQLNEGLRDVLYDENTPGVIVHITDIYADNPSKAHVLYCATKAGLENMTKGFAKKFAPGVRVMSVQPGPIQFLNSHTEEEKQQVLSETLLDYEGGFLSVFQTIDSIFSNAYLTGSCIKVDGGRALGGR